MTKFLENRIKLGKNKFSYILIWKSIKISKKFLNWFLAQTRKILKLGILKSFWFLEDLQETMNGTQWCSSQIWVDGTFVSRACEGSGERISSEGRRIIEHLDKFP